MMKQYILDTMESARHGLYLTEFPTGYGKTYTAANAMKEYADNSDPKRKIIYLTTLKKNLPTEELLNAYDGNEEAYSQRVLRIRSNFDEVVDNLEKVSVPPEFQKEAYQKLLKLIRNYPRAKQNGDSEYRLDFEKRINDAEREFRREITRKLTQTYGNKSARLAAIHTDSQWQWVGKLYPAVFTDERQILLMTVRKFMERNSCLVEPSYEFLKSPLVEDAIIFMDEFDATKADMQSAIKEKALRYEGEYLSLFKQICRSLDSSQYLSSPLMRAVKKAEEAVKPQYALESLQRDAKAIIGKYHIYLSYKTSEDALDRKQNFLLKDATYHTLFQEGKEYIRAVRNETENRVDVLMWTKEEFRSRRDVDSEMSVYGLLREINRFLARFRIFLLSWATNYMRIMNEARISSAPDSDAMTMENALKTILHRLALSDQQGDLILGAVLPAERNKKRELLPDNSFYQRGLEIFELEDSDAHYDSTDFRFVSVRDTPEKILSYLAERAVVFGISATAEIPSVVGNYDLNYLRERLGDAYHPTPSEQKRKIEGELSETWAAYHNQKVRIYSEVMESETLGLNLEERCGKVFLNPEYAQFCAKWIADETARIADTDKPDFFHMRYLNAVTAMYRFCEKPGIQSMLYLGKKLPKENDPELNLALLKKIFDKLIVRDAARRCGAEISSLCAENSLVVINSDQFDERKEELVARLGNGEKIFIMSSYATIGAGQNLQYPAPNRAALVELVPDTGNGDKRHLQKDIDALYIGDVTHLTANTYFGQKLTRETLMDMLFQIEELKENAELSFAEADEMIKLAFRAYAGKAGGKRNLLYKAESVNWQADRQVMQAIGRMCRTYLKAPEIYLFIEKRLLAKLSPWELKKHILSPEMEAIVKLAENIGANYPDEEKKRLRVAEKISNSGMSNIRGILRGNWTEESMLRWVRLREVVLKHPTASASDRESEEIIRKLYITSGRPQNQYQYAQDYDYTSVIIDFGTDAAAFRKSERLKREADSETGVYMMSAEASRLPAILKYPGMRDYFESHGFALKFEAAEYMMSPPLFNNIYKGALGEVAGRFILKSELGIELSEIRDPKKFEFFDYELSPGVYVDFKNWKFSYRQDREKTKREIRDKLEEIDGKRVYVVNIVGDEEYAPTEQADAKIVEIPRLIDGNGAVVKSCIRMFREEDCL